MVDHEPNVFEHLREWLELFITLDENSIQKLAEACNEYGANLSMRQIAKITGFSASQGEAHSVRSALANLTHNYYHHREKFESEKNKTKFEKKDVNKIMKFIESLNENGIKGLNTRFEIGRSTFDHVLTSMGSKVFLQEIFDENSNSLGYVPTVRIDFHIQDSDKDEISFSKLDMEIDDLIVFGKSLEAILDDSIMRAKKFKEKMGDLVILAGSE